ncbi:3-mercaptopyruvate sulfurtransferase [Exaiptasia diaphana]|uniref:Rhodanese domain-containing protein n=1 Tax=Exaiptasia diaphana TaxID=2652724 RepID=A0A913YB54_EXADI|nr:3-mercaptopyruvate sulfurtransferase [Exaiptasia diaphana]KXJ21244.1 3-mercaptopyruvate sulfurtransferase [Exaiptasia diaphana]
MCARPLVRVQWLHQMLKENPSRIRVLDGSWYLPSAKRDPPKEFLEKRIPGARFFDIDDCRDKTNPYEHMIPSEEDFGKYVSKLGITNDSHVVVYDSYANPGVSAPRTWWTFRVFGHENVSVLDGGLHQWCASGFPTESGDVPEDSSKDNAPFKANFNPNLVCDFEFIMNNIKSDNPVKVIDARPPGRFTGVDPEPRPQLSSGHMPKSSSLPYLKCINTEAKCFKDPDELKKLFSGAGFSDLSKPLVTSCGSGVTGSGLLFASFLCGKTDTKLYDGSWTEFVQRAPQEMIIKGE